MKGKFMICQNEIMNLPSINLENKIETEPDVFMNEIRNGLESKTSNGITETKRKVLGIYKIVNKVNGKYYVGSSNDIQLRWRKHKSDLNNQNHVNEHLQHSWNKYGSNNFEFSIVEELSKEKLMEVEQKHLDVVNKEKNRCYNLSFIADRIEMTSETLKKIINGNKGKVRSQETKKKIKLATTGINNPMFSKSHSEKSKQKMSQHRLKRNYTLVSPTNQTVQIKNLKKFCKDNNLNEGGMYGVYKGRYKHYKGWKFII